MRLSHLAAACGLGAPHNDVEVADITFDSREVRPGTLFVALAGATRDGHAFIATAVAAGAAAVLLDRSRVAEFANLTVPLLVVDDTRAALGLLAAAFYRHPARELAMVGITGTNGKTTTSFLLEAVLRNAGRAPGVIGTVNYRWRDVVEPAPNTTPESLVVQRLLRRMRDDGVDSVAMEVSSHGLSTHRLTGTQFDVALFTNLSQDHLDFHGTMQHYFDAKLRLFTEHLAAGGVAVVNVDDAHGRELAAKLGAAVTVSAAGAAADWSCREVAHHVDGTEITLVSPHDTRTFRTGLLGEFNVSNALQTLAAADALGVDLDTSTAALAALRGVPGRLQHIGGGDRPHVFVDYAHTPDALARALTALRPLTRGALTVVFGCGGDRDRQKRPLMAQAAEQHADRIIVTSDNPRSESPDAILDDIVAGFTARANVARDADRARAIATAVSTAAPDDVILLAGKGHETYQEIHGVRRDFDDLEHARRALESLL